MKNKLIITLLVIFVLIILSVLIDFNYNNKFIYTLNLADVNNISSISLTIEDSELNFDKKIDIKEIINILYSNGRTTKISSIQDVPVNVTNEISINIYDKDTKISKLFIYEKNAKYFLEQPYNGIYEISADEYNTILNFKTSTPSLNSYYNSELTKGYTSINELEEDYSIEDAINDNCFVVNHAKVYNENLYEEFMNKYNKKENAYIRMVMPTIEGDLVIYDIKYDKDIDKIILVVDNTRDKFSSDSDRIISLNEYEKIGTYKYNNGNLFWVAYNDYINDDTFNTDNVFILTVVN